jgi:hypothetical protein
MAISFPQQLLQVSHHIRFEDDFVAVKVTDDSAVSFHLPFLIILIQCTIYFFKS